MQGTMHGWARPGLAVPAAVYPPLPDQGAYIRVLAASFCAGITTGEDHLSARPSEHIVIYIIQSAPVYSLFALLCLTIRRLRRDAFTKTGLPSTR